VRAPWAKGLDWVPNVATRYAGHTIDSFITRDVARHADRAAGCWAGTQYGNVTLDFHVARVAAETGSGTPTQAPLVYATHTMSSWRPYVDTFKGTIANQEAFYCTRPETAKVTFQTPGCDGCDVAVMNGASRPENQWDGGTKTVQDDQVTCRIPRPRTHGLSMTVVAPWEGDLGYTTVVSFRYPGHDVGDAVDFSDARSQKRGSPCWGGTSHPDLTIPLTVRQVTVPGSTGPTDGTIAYADLTQAWLKPMLPGHQGVLGAQDLIVCQR
jgi:hypothetical protein